MFAGPFDLLLHLILREQVELYEVSLSDIVDGFVAEVEQMEDVDLETATEFLLIAATLVELKTRRLLPGHGVSDIDDELGIWEERDLLLARLVECKTFKDAAVALEHIATDAGRSYPRSVGMEDEFLALSPDLLSGVRPTMLRDAFLRAVTPKPSVQLTLDHVAPLRASVTDALEELLEELPLAGRVSFTELTASLVDRIEVVVRFLAILELFKDGRVELDQTKNFGDIMIVWTGKVLPTAGTLPEHVDTYEG